MCDPVVLSTGHGDAPWVTTDLAVLNEAAVDVRLDVDLQLLAAKRTRDQKVVWHLRILAQCGLLMRLHTCTCIGVTVAWAAVLIHGPAGVGNSAIV